MEVFLGPPSTTAGIYHLVQGPQLVRVFMRLLSVLMTCLLYAACVAFTFCSPGRRAFTFLYCLGAAGLCYVEVRPVTLSGVRPVLAFLANLWVRLRSSADFVAGSLVGWFPWT